MPVLEASLFVLPVHGAVEVGDFLVEHCEQVEVCVHDETLDLPNIGAVVWVHVLAILL